MAISLDLQKEFVYYKQQFRLPFDKNKPLMNHFIGLMINDTTQSPGILNNKLIYRDAKYARYFKPIRYIDRIFTASIRNKMTNDEQKEISQFCSSNMNLSFFNRAAMIKNKNIIVDLSQIHKAFIDNSQGKSYLKICESYMAHLSYYLHTVCGELKQQNRYLILNTKDWGIDVSNKTKISSSSQKMLNPIAMIFQLLRKNPDALSVLDNYTLIVLDSDNGWFKWKISNRDEKTPARLYSTMNKLKSKDISLDSTVDSDEQEKLENKADEIKDKPETTVSKQKAAHAASASTDDTDDDTSKLDKLSDSIASEIDKLSEAEAISKDELEIAKKVIDDNFDNISRTVSKNKRLNMLREKQKKIQIDSIKMSDLEDHKKTNYEIDSEDISTKVFSPNNQIKKIKFDNMNKAYNKNVRTKDIMNVFKALNNKKDLPVTITSITKENTSTPMDLKETWHVKMEDDRGVKHSVTVDLPIVYDNNYMYLGGNRKQFVNQQILKPLIKISPTTAQICTNYSKMFMYREGDIMAPKVTIFKKIIANNPAIFKVRRGSGLAFNNKHLTTIEYDSLAMDYVEIMIRGKGIGLKFDQEFYDELIRNKELDPIDSNKFLYCIYDSRPNAKVKAFVTPIETDAIADYSEDYTKDPSKLYMSPIDVFVNIYYRETGKNFWDLATEKDKAGKRFMYTSCKIMQRKIPTIILLGYFEGITTVLKKQGIDYKFYDKRPKAELSKGIIQFSDGYLVYPMIPAENSLLLSGLQAVDTKSYTFADFDTKNPYLDIFNEFYNNRALASALDAFYDNMIDPISAEILESMNLPTDFVRLVLCANTLLADNNYSSEISLTEFRVRNMEMIPVFLYKAISNAYSNYKRHANESNPEKISIAKNQIIKEIMTSQVCEDVSVINPITEKEKNRAITCKGPSGINLEQSYTKAKRCFDETMTGAMCISTSPDANCGVVRELTVEPKVINSRGFIDCESPSTEMKQNTLFGFSELVNGVGVTMDDSIRKICAA